jgi:hypothetical protein
MCPCFCDLIFLNAETGLIQADLRVSISLQSLLSLFLVKIALNTLFFIELLQKYGRIYCTAMNLSFPSKTAF